MATDLKPKQDAIYGLKSQVTTRKPPSYLDAMFFPTLFWDGRASTTFTDPVEGTTAIAIGGALESQAAGPPVNDLEMACEATDAKAAWSRIADKLKDATPLAKARRISPTLLDGFPDDIKAALTKYPKYPQLFGAVFNGDETISAKHIVFAIATHERRLTSNQTPWDRFNAGDKNALSREQQHGLALFNTKARCNKCHTPPLFTDKGFHNVGFIDPELDKGRSAITNDPTDLGKMKTPTLRNVGLREAGGLMHGGGATVAGQGRNLQSVIWATMRAARFGPISIPRCSRSI